MFNIGDKVKYTGTDCLAFTKGNIYTVDSIYSIITIHGPKNTIIVKDTNDGSHAMFFAEHFELVNNIVTYDPAKVKLYLNGEFIKYATDCNYSIIKPCSHKWKKYQGFTENYEYCEFCDIKSN